jgi:branched-chain amino acid transport system permease protein
MIVLSGIAGLFFVFGVYFDEDQTFIFGLTGDFFAGVSGIVLSILLIINGGIYSLVISRVIERDLFTSLLATFGLAIMMAQILNLLFGSDTQSVDLGYPTLHFFDGFIDVPIAKLIGVCMAAVLAAGVILFMKNSRMGQAIRATSQDARAARVLGIDTEKVYAFTFSLNSAICGAAGAIIVMVWLVQPFYGISYSIRAFVIVTAAGLGNLPGVIAAGLGIGALEQYGAHIFGIGYQQAVAVLLLLIVLLYRLIQQRRNRQVLK